MTGAVPTPPRTRSPFLRPVPIAIGAVVVLLLVIVAVRRGGVLDLPPVPSGATIEAAGLNNIGELRERLRALETMTSRADVRGAALEGDPHLAKAAEGLAAVRRGEGESGLQKLREALSEQPDDLVIGNTYRMSVLSLRRSALANGGNRDTLAERLPGYLQNEPVATLEPLYRKHPSRETGFQLALGWVDDILMTPKPEARVVAGLASMKLLNEILAKDPYYVPALCARGVGYLNPPARIDFIPAWKETLRPVPNAASRDLALCVAIGRQVGGGSAQTAAEQALNLGDAYAKEGQLERARSWWQLAQNASRDPDLLEQIRRRYNWRDGELVEQLEADREARAADLDHPLTDLSSTWR